MLDSDEYRQLRSSDKVVLAYLCSRYNGQNGTEADPIICPYSDFPVKSGTAAGCLKRLVAGGWIVRSSNGGLMRNPNRYVFGPTLRSFYG